MNLDLNPFFQKTNNNNLVIIHDNTKFNKQKVEILQNCKEGIIVRVKDREKVPVLFGLLTKFVDKEYEYFLFPYEYEIVEEERYLRTALRETFQCMEVAYKPALCPPPPKKYSCPRCKKMGALNESVQRLECCAIDIEMVYGWNTLYKNKEQNK